MEGSATGMELENSEAVRRFLEEQVPRLRKLVAAGSLTNDHIDQVCAFRNPFPEGVLTVGDVMLNTRLQNVVREKKVIQLSPRECQFLFALMSSPGKILSRDALLALVGLVPGEMGGTNVVDVYINYIRKKIDAGFASELIQTVRGKGYRFGSPPAME